MSETFVIYPDMGIDRPVLWGRFDDGRLQQSGRAALEECAAHADGADVWLVAPGTDVTLHRVEMPARSEGKARAMLPFLLEDDMAVGLSDMHLALGPLVDGARLVVAVAKARMDGWVEALEMQGLSPKHMVADYLCLPQAEDTQTLAIGDLVIARLSDGRGFAAQADIARLLLADAGHMAAPTAIGEAAALERFFTGMSHAGIDLLQGTYEPRHALRFDARTWKRTAVIGGLAAASYMMLLLSQAWWYDQQAEALDGQTEAMLRQVFPDIGRVVNPRAQMQARLNELRGGSSDQFLQLSRLLVASVSDVEGVTIRSLRYDDGRAELAAEMAYADFEDMEAVKAAVTRQGGQLEEGGSRNNGESMIGDVRVSTR